METDFNGCEWTCLSTLDGKRFLGYGTTEVEAKRFCMELMRDHNLEKAASTRMLNRIVL